MSKSLVVLAVLAIFVGGCASVPMASLDQDAAAKRFDETVNPSRAQIYLFRDQVVGGAISMPVAFAGKVAGGTGPKTFFLWEVQPGQYEIQSLTENISSITIDARPGETYFVRQKVKMGWVSARSQLQLVSAAEGRKGVAKCKRIQSTM